MKTLITMLAATMIVFSAQAQSKKHSRFAQNYSVCQIGGNYQVCGENQAMKPATGRKQTVTASAMNMTATNVYMGERNLTRGRGRIRVSYAEDPNGAYEGKETSINDGVQENKERNLNQYNDAVVLPPNDGGLSDHR